MQRPGIGLAEPLTFPVHPVLELHVLGQIEPIQERTAVELRRPDIVADTQGTLELRHVAP
jgi:hypothetical protein